MFHMVPQESGMQPLALDLSSFLPDIQNGHLPATDWPRLARDLGTQAIDIPLTLLLALDPIASGHYLRQELHKYGVVIAAVRDNGFCALETAPSLTGAPAWTTAFWDAMRLLVLGDWGVGLVVLRPPPSDALGLFNRVGANICRARLIASEWLLRLSVSNEDTRGYMGFVADVPGLGLCLDGSRLPQDRRGRWQALEVAHASTRLIRLDAGGTDDTRLLGAWRDLLITVPFDGFVSVRCEGTGDRYATAGTAISILKSVKKTRARGATSLPHHRRR